jgi:probable HAF family extracellular repeat protein
MAIRPSLRPLSACCLLAWPLASLAATPCAPALVDLGTLGGGYSVATGLNDHGTVVGYSPNAAGVEHAFMSRAGRLVDLALQLPADRQALPSRADALNAAGQVAGTVNERQMWRYTPATRRMDTSAATSDDFAMAYCRITGLAADGALVGRSGYPINGSYNKSGFVTANPQDAATFTDLDNFLYGACNTFLPAMNAAGDVSWQGAGGTALPPAQGKGGVDAYSLRSGGSWSFAHAPAPTTLPGASRPEVALFAFNDARQAAATAHGTTTCGYRWGEWGDARATVFDANSQRYLDLGAGLYGPDGQSLAYAISADGRWVAGSSAPANSHCPVVATATLFKRQASGAVKALNVAPAGNQTDSRALSVTAKGQVLGHALATFDRYSDPRPFVYTRTAGSQFLDVLFPALSQIEPDLFQNEAGQIAGTALLAGQRHAFRIDCPSGTR